MKDNLYMVTCYETLHYFCDKSYREDESLSPKYIRIRRTLHRLNEAGVTEDHYLGTWSIVCNPFCKFIRLTDTELEQYKQCLNDYNVTFARLE